MKYRRIALMLALLLAVAFPASAGGRLPDGFDVDRIIALYNDQLMKAFMAVYPTQTAEKVSQYRTYGATPEADVIRFNDRDGKVWLSAHFLNGDMDMSGPTDVIAYTIGSGVDLLDIPVLRSAFAGMVARADSGADLQAIMDWMAAGDGALPMNGYTLTYTRGPEGDVYSLVAEGTDAGDARTEPTPEPPSEPESGPDVIEAPEPVTASDPDDGPDILDAPTPAPARETPTGADVLLSWKGFEVTPLRTERWQFSNGYISLRLFVRVVNETGTKLTLRVEDMTVDGVPLPATNIFDIETGTDTGMDSEEGILSYVDEDITDSVAQAVLYGSDMSMKLILWDAKTYEDVYMEKVAVDLSALPNKITIAEPSDDPTPAPTKAPKPTRTPEIPDRNVYQPLFEGDKGEDVRRMQRRLIELGYLNDTADGKYGPRTAAAVAEFCETNGLGAYAYASASMLELLYSNDATPYQEPWVPLIFQEGAWGEWRKAKNDELGFHAKVTNTSRTHTVRAFELYMYATDVWGDKIYGDKLYYGTSSKTVKPGASVYSDYFLLPNRSQIATVWCGIKKVIFTDGTIRENDTVSYTSWTIK